MAGLVRRSRPMDLSAGSYNVFLEELELEVEMLKRMVFDGFADVAQRLEFGEPLDREPPALGKPASHQAQRPLQYRVAEAGAGVGLEGAAGREHVLARNADRRDFFGHAGEHLGDMADLQPRAMAMELAGNV